MVALIFAVLAGIFTTVEATINVKLSRLVTPKIATLHNLITGLLVILIAILLNGSLNEYKKIIHAKPQWLIGGVFGTFIVYLCIRAIPKLGTAKTLTIVVAAQLISGLLIDHFYLKEDISISKFVAVFLLLIGTYITVR